MNILFELLNNELKSFWSWSNIDEVRYSRHEWVLYLEEWEYSNWDKLMNLAHQVIDEIKNTKANVLINNLLTIMALDNEAEILLDKCESELSDGALKRLVENTLHHMQPEARWQVAEILGRKSSINWEEYLIKFTEDSDKYVQRRALLSLHKISSNKAESIALKKLHDEDDYLRLVSIRILKELSSPYLKNAVEYLKNDKFIYVQKEIEEIISK